MELSDNLPFVTNITSGNCLRVAVGFFVPYSRCKMNGTNCIPSGVFWDALKIVNEKFGFCFTVKHDLAFPGFQLENGTWNGVIGMLTNKYLDISIYPINYVMHRDVDTSTTLFEGLNHIMAKRPTPQPDIVGFTKPFTFSVWLLIFLALVTIAAGISLLSSFTFGAGFRSSIKKQGTAFFQCLEWGWQTLCGQGKSLRTSKIGATVIVVFWLLISVILSSLYKSLVQANLIAPIMVFRFNTFEKFINEPSMKMRTAVGGRLEVAVNSAPPNSTLGRLKSQLVPTVFNPYKDKWSRPDDTVSVGPHDALLALGHIEFSRYGYCWFYISKEGILADNKYGLGYQHNSALRDLFNPYLVRLKESGILLHLRNLYLSNASHCLVQKAVNAHEARRVLVLKDFYGVFILYFGGLVLALLAFIGELISYKVTSK